MTKRSTQQAARAYQRSHAVSYMEALRRVGAVGEPSTVNVGPVRSDRSPVDVTATGFLLGEALAPASSLTAGSTPAWWYPAEAMGQNTPATLAVYGPTGAGKTSYLAALVRRHLVGVSTLLVTAERDAYPQQRGLTHLERSYADPDGMDREAEDRLVAAMLDAVSAETQVVVFDEGYRWTPALGHFLRMARSLGLVVLFTGHSVGDAATAPVGDPSVIVMLRPERPDSAGDAWGPRGSWVQREGSGAAFLMPPRQM